MLGYLSDWTASRVRGKSVEQNGREKKRRSKVVVESEKVRFEEDGRKKKKTGWKRSRRVGERGGVESGWMNGDGESEGARERDKRMGGSGAREGRKRQGRGGAVGRSETEREL